MFYESIFSVFHASRTRLVKYFQLPFDAFWGRESPFRDSTSYFLGGEVLTTRCSVGYMATAEMGNREVAT